MPPCPPRHFPTVIYPAGSCVYVSWSAPEGGCFCNSWPRAVHAGQTGQCAPPGCMKTLEHRFESLKEPNLQTQDFSTCLGTLKTGLPEQACGWLIFLPPSLHDCSSTLTK